jgi:hypothetical protein
VAGTCEFGYEHSASLNFVEFLDYLIIGELVKEDSQLWSKYRGADKSLAQK